jgi:hypothetical protein
VMVPALVVSSTVLVMMSVRVKKQGLVKEACRSVFDLCFSNQNGFGRHIAVHAA